jgi:hypothetical protein
VDSDRDLDHAVGPAMFSPDGVHTENDVFIRNSGRSPHIHSAYELRKVFFQI